MKTNNGVVPPPTEREILALGYLSAELASRADAWSAKDPVWFPEPPEWLDLWEEALAATAGAADVRGPRMKHAETKTLNVNPPPNAVPYALDIQILAWRVPPPHSNRAAPEMSGVNRAAAQAARRVVEDAGWIIGYTGYGSKRDDLK
jgi:hypothetical protein